VNLESTGRVERTCCPPRSVAASGSGDDPWVFWGVGTRRADPDRAGVGTSGAHGHQMSRGDKIRTTPQRDLSARTLAIVGEPWSLSIIGEALSRGATFLVDFQRNLGAPARMLGPRLDGLVLAGLMTLRSGSAHRDQWEYVLTERGRDLRSVVEAMGAWGNRWSALDGSGIVTAASCGPGAMLATEPVWSEAEKEPLRTDPVAEISVLGALVVRTSHDVPCGLSRGAQRLLAFLALRDRPVARVAAAGALWPEVSDQKAGSSLRSALARMDPGARSVIHATPTELGLRDGVAVDLREARALAHRLMEHGREADPDDLGLGAVSKLSSELLPDWYESWVVTEAEDWRQLRMSALEAEAAVLGAGRRYAEAAAAARASMRAEPLRESAHASLVRIHLAEGNQSEAMRVYERYRGLLRTELDVEPTTRLSDLLWRVRERNPFSPSCPMEE